jgi:abortive infection bacteriophage resistance protein
LAHDLGTFGYADRANFDSHYDHIGMMNILAKEERKSTELFVRHYRGKYTAEAYLPVWMATELLTFGVLSKMYGSVRKSLRKKIAQEFGLPEPVFVSWLHALAAIRNVAAHHSRLWNRELAVKPQLPAAWKAAGLTNNRLYVIALIIQSLLAATSPGSKWKERLKAHFNASPPVDLNAMHFPPDWQNRAPWV